MAVDSSTTFFAALLIIALTWAILYRKKRGADNQSTALLKPGNKPPRKSGWKQAKLALRKNLSPDSCLLRFTLADGDTIKLKMGRHIMLRTVINGERVVRPYTPVSPIDQQDSFDLVVKRYDMGKMSCHVHSMELGSAIEARGPIGNLKYEANQFKHIICLAAGTGITPMYQIMREVAADEGDHTLLSLFYQNRREEDILLRAELQALDDGCPEATIVHALSMPPPAGWEGHSGYITADAINDATGGAAIGADDVQVFVCGPQGFQRSLVEALKAQGHSEQRIRVL